MRREGNEPNRDPDFVFVEIEAIGYLVRRLHAKPESGDEMKVSMGIVRRRLVGTVLAFALLLTACGDGGTGTTSTTPVTTATSSPSDPGSTVARGAPRWETVTTLSGSGPAEPAAFSILTDSIQWRARWKCDAGRLLVTTDPAPRRPKPLIDVACPGKGEDFAIVTGSVRLKIEATGPWEVIVDQQVDAPLREPLLDGMAGAPVVRQGTFVNLEKQAKGSARIVKRADGSLVLRLEDFEVSTNVDLFLWISEAVAPKTNAEAATAPHQVIGNLKSTNGNQNYILPTNLPVERMQSIVIWCEPVRTAYGAAALVP